MRRYLAALAVFLLLSQAALAAETYSLDPARTVVDWRVRLFGFSDATGVFKIKRGVVTLDRATPAKSAVRVTIDTESLSTGNGAADRLLKGKGFLHTGKYPAAVFKSSRVNLGRQGRTASVTGALTLHGVTHPVTLDVTLERRGRGVLAFRAVTTIQRSDFGIVKYRAVASDEVRLTIEGEARRP